MPKQWDNKGAAAVKDKPAKKKAAENKSDNMKITKKDIARLSGKPLTPFQSKVPRKPLGVYLSEQERAAIACRALDAGVTEGEWIRNVIRKVAKLN